QQIKHDRAEYQKQLQSWQEGVQQDISRQQSEADKSGPAGGSSAGASTGGGAPPPEPPPASGFLARVCLAVDPQTSFRATAISQIRRHQRESPGTWALSARNKRAL